VATSGREPWAESFRCAGAGILAALKSERNLRFDVVFGLATVGLGLAIGLDAYEWVAVVICITAVFAAEVFNTAIEATVDLVSPERCDLARLAKDASAGATLICAAGSAVVGLLIFLPKVLALLSRL
jgi:diacylglycerol kinase (ATP)